MSVLEHYKENTYHEHLNSSTLSHIRDRALSTLKTTETPNRRDENWKYTNVNQILENNYTVQKNADAVSLNLKDDAFYTLVFIDGVFSHKNSDMIDLEITEISKINNDQILSFENHFKDDFLGIINQSNLSNGSFIEFKKNTSFDRPLLFDFYYTGTKALRNTNNYIYAHESASVNILERVQSKENCFINQSSSFYLKANSSIHYTSLQIANQESFVGLTTQSQIEKDATFTQVAINLGAKMSRSNIAAILQGENATANIHGLYGLADEQHHDTFSFIQHKSPLSFSSQLYKGVLGGSSRGVFTGKIRIEKDAQKVLSDQLNKNLILTPKAHANSRPQLEIYADDVKCAHGSTTGQINPDELFYFESRAISAERAKKILTSAFAFEIIFKISSEVIKEIISNELQKRELI